MDNIDHIITQIKNRIREAEESQKKEPLSNAAVKRLEKEIDKLIDLLKHYSTLRWTITSFFMTVGFGISGYFFSETLKAPDTRFFQMFICSLIGPLIFLFATALFKWHNDLIDSLMDNLEARGRILGYHSLASLRETNVKKKIKMLFGVTFVIYLFVAPFLTILFLSPLPLILPF